jgi:signal transduction histidine kinase/DNA-binding response OmpR family regulator
MSLADLIDDPLIDEAPVISRRLAPLRSGIVLLGSPIAILALGPWLTALMFIPILLSELLIFWATAPFARKQAIGYRERLRYLVSSATMNGAWLSIGVVCWTSGDPLLRNAAIALWCAHMFFVANFMHAAIATLIAAGAPVAVTTLLLPLIDHPGNSATAWFATFCVALCFCYAFYGALLAHKKSRALRAATQMLAEQKAAAEAANESKTAFLAAISHEIRTPLNGVLGMAQSLQAEDLTPDQEEQVSTIIESGETLMALLNDVLDLSKIEAGKFEVVPVNTDLRHKITRVFKLFQPRAEEKGLHFTLDIDRSVPPLIVCDAVRVRQCVSNLVSNAIKFTDVGAVAIRVRGETIGAGRVRIVIGVRDTGIGMSREALANLFSEFGQADTTISRRYGGTGLGLAIARKIARLMQGDIAAESESGIGSTFHFSFEAAVAALEDAIPASPAAETVLDAGLNGKRVLIVDDNPVNRKVATLFLKYMDFEVAEAENGLVALEMLHDEQFDLVLLDLHMPVMDGEETVRQIRDGDEDWSDIPVIALTADMAHNDLNSLYALGMDGYVAKPISQDALLGEIYRVLGEYEARGHAAGRAGIPRAAPDHAFEDEPYAGDLARSDASPVTYDLDDEGEELLAPKGSKRAG